jgi:TetR/AcrR family transcriptional repressor of bet genes
MPKLGLQPVRRRQLIEATVATIHACGYGDTTMARIAKRAGMSPGIIAHYFGGKDELLAATMRSLLEALKREVVQRLREARTPRERVEAVVMANMAESQSTPEVAACWLAFWAQVPHAPELARLQRVYLRRLHSNLVHELRRLGLDDAAAARAAELLGSLIDGLWLRAALSGQGLDARRARAQVMNVLRRELDGSETAPDATATAKMDS